MQHTASLITHMGFYYNFANYNFRQTLVETYLVTQMGFKGLFKIQRFS